MKHKTVFIPDRIVSGGQTGVDRSALDVAIALGIEHGGWCPAGRRAEDGSIPSRYVLQESDSPEYPVRTEQNVVDSDATLILYSGPLQGGTRLTLKFCRRWNKPHLAVQIDADGLPQVRQWLQQTRPATLNVAGPRESTVPGIGKRATEFLLRIFDDRGA